MMMISWVEQTFIIWINPHHLSSPINYYHKRLAVVFLMVLVYVKMSSSFGLKWKKLVTFWQIYKVSLQLLKSLHSFKVCAGNLKIIIVKYYYLDGEIAVKSTFLLHDQILFKLPVRYRICINCLKRVGSGFDSWFCPLFPAKLMLVGALSCSEIKIEQCYNRHQDFDNRPWFIISWLRCKSLPNSVILVPIAIDWSQHFRIVMIMLLYVDVGLYSLMLLLGLMCISHGSILSTGTLSLF